MKRALIVGVNTYENLKPLALAVADAQAVSERLSQHADGTPNYECHTVLDRFDNGEPVTRSRLRAACETLFKDFASDVLFYYAGHGSLQPAGGYLVTTDAHAHDLGIPMQEIIDLGMRSHARSIAILLDCCNAGSAGNPALLQAHPGDLSRAALREDMTVIAASTEVQSALESREHGLFTGALLDALDGGAADVLGEVTAGALYGYVERRFGAWDQRPVFKSHVTRSLLIRQCVPLVSRLDLRRLAEHFPAARYRYPLDPEYEPEDEHGRVPKVVNRAKVEVAQLFKRYRDAGLLQPSLGGEQLFWTARLSHTVELTALGREYWWLVKNRKI